LEVNAVAVPAIRGVPRREVAAAFTGA
jgi:hypothetical protein